MYVKQHTQLATLLTSSHVCCYSNKEKVKNNIIMHVHFTTVNCLVLIVSTKKSMLLVDSNKQTTLQFIQDSYACQSSLEDSIAFLIVANLPSHQRLSTEQVHKQNPLVEFLCLSTLQKPLFLRECLTSSLRAVGAVHLAISQRSLRKQSHLTFLKFLL